MYNLVLIHVSHVDLLFLELCGTAMQFKLLHLKTVYSLPLFVHDLVAKMYVITSWAGAQMSWCGLPGTIVKCLHKSYTKWLSVPPPKEATYRATASNYINKNVM